MPRKGDKRKGRRTRGTPVPQQPAAGSTATGVTTSSSNPSTSKSSPPIKGRKTKNSLKGRQPPAKPTSVKRNGNVGRGMKRKAQSDQSTYISDDQIVYKPNGKYFSVCVQFLNLITVVHTHTDIIVNKIIFCLL